MIDCAVYGKRNNARHVDWSQAIEEKTYELGGIKTLISRNHHTRERFWQIYDRAALGGGKARTRPGRRCSATSTTSFTRPPPGLEDEFRGAARSQAVTAPPGR